MSQVRSSSQPALAAARLAPLVERDLSAEQKVAFAKLDAYFNFGGAPGGNFAVWLGQAGMAEGGFELFLAHRHEEKLERRLFELVVLTVARSWSAVFPWSTHAPAGLRCGLDAEVIEAIRLGQTPQFVKADERAAYALIAELTHDRRVTPGTYDEAVEILGSERVVALVNAAGFYAMVATATVAYETPLLERFGPPATLPPLGDLPTVAFGSPPPGAETRLSELDYDALSPAQQAEVAKLRAFFKMAPPGPFQVWAHQPGVANGAFQLYLTHRFQGTVERRLMEVMAITVVRSWGCQFEWPSHAKHAVANGVSPQIVEAIRLGETPRFVAEDERATYDLVNELSSARRISQATFDRAVGVLGGPQVNALVNGASFYTMVCMTLVAFDVPALVQPPAAAARP